MHTNIEALERLETYLQLKQYVRQIRIMAILKQIDPDLEPLFIEALMTDALGKDQHGTYF